MDSGNTHLQPKGSGFNLDVNARVDTSRWLEVSGVVTVVRGLAVIEGQLVARGTLPSEPAPSEPVARVRTVGPPVEVVFSLPTHGETDVKPGASVRIQFSREIDRTSIAGRVLVAYGAAEAPVTDATAPPIEFTTSYAAGPRTLEILSTSCSGSRAKYLRQRPRLRLRPAESTVPRKASGRPAQATAPSSRSRALRAGTAASARSRPCAPTRRRRGARPRSRARRARTRTAMPT